MTSTGNVDKSEVHRPDVLQVYLVTELLLGGELLDAVLERGSYSESDARLCFAQLLSGIDYLHSRFDFLF